MKNIEFITLGRTNSDIICDLSKNIPELPENIKIVIHAAGKAHIVPKTESEAKEFNDINFIGTQKLISAIERKKILPENFIFISSVAVYGLSIGNNITEETPLNAVDPYGKSKIQAEKYIIDFCNKKNIKYCILRLPLIAGKNAPGNLGAMIRSIKNGWYFSVGKANNKKSMVMAEDVAAFIPSLLKKTGIYNLTDGYNPTFEEIEKGLAAVLKKRNPLKIPQNMATFLAKIGDVFGKNSPFNTYKLKKMQSTLTFSDKKAREELGWQPMKVIDNLDKII